MKLVSNNSSETEIFLTWITIIVVGKAALPPIVIKSLLPKSEVCKCKQEAFTPYYYMASVTPSC